MNTQTAQLIDGHGTINVQWEGLKRLAKEFSDAAPDANVEELDAGWKCFGIAWMNCKFGDTFFDQVARDAEHPALLRIMRDIYMKHKIPLLEGFTRNGVFTALR